MSIFLASLMIGVAASPPVADTPTGPEIAQCVVDNDMKDVRTLLKTLPGSPAEAKASVKVLPFYGGCNDNKLAGGTFAWHERAEIAEAAAAEMIGGKHADVGTAVAQAGWALVVPADAKPPADYDTTGVGMRMLGDCVLRANPQAVVDLLRAGRGSTGEAAAINSLSGNIASCLTAGQTFKLKRQDLRLLVAEPLYHVLSR